MDGVQRGGRWVRSRRGGGGAESEQLSGMRSGAAGRLLDEGATDGGNRGAMSWGARDGRRQQLAANHSLAQL